MMINFLSNYAKNLIYITIIIGILELVLPNNKNKKYIKVIMGMFVILAILSPFTKRNIDFENEFSEKYLNIAEPKSNLNKRKNENIMEESGKESSQSNEQEKDLTKIFEIKLKENINEYMKEKGYEGNINVKTQNYEIENIKISKIRKNKSNEMINKIEINLEQKKEEISEDEIKNLKEDLIKKYGAKNVEISDK